MLYDNALLAMAYLEAYQATGNSDFARTCRETLRYADRDMREPGGAFYTASDADSHSASGEKVEGWYYTWSVQEFGAALNARDLAVATGYFGVSEKGNLDGRNVLRVAQSLDELSVDLNIGSAALLQSIDRSREALYRLRSQRPLPFRDEKILTAWNGLMISAFARAALTFADGGYLDAATDAARFVLDHMQKDGRLMRTYIGGKTSGGAFADDYAFFIQALIDLYQASGDIEWFTHAVRLQDVMNDDFEDAGAGAFFLAPETGAALLARAKPTYDGSVPSANSVAVLNLLRLYELTSDDSYRRRAQDLFRNLGAVLAASPAAAPDLLQALDFYTDDAKTIVLVTPGDRGDADPFLQILGSTFLPNHVLTVVTEGPELDRQAAIIPLLEGKRAMRGRTTAYVCIHGICDLPTSDPLVFAAQIGARSP